MKGNKILYAGIAILILGIGFAVGTYAYYQSTVSGTIGGTVLAWQCTVDNQESSFTISLGNLYPGSSVEKTITLRSSIDAEYTITFESFTNMGSESTHPNLNIYKDSAHSTVINTSSTITGNITGGSSAGTPVTLYVYWPYGTYEDYNSAAPSVTVKVACKQV